MACEHGTRSLFTNKDHLAWRSVWPPWFSMPSPCMGLAGAVSARDHASKSCVVLDDGFFVQDSGNTRLWVSATDQQFLPQRCCARSGAHRPRCQRDVVSACCAFSLALAALFRFGNRGRGARRRSAWRRLAGPVRRQLSALRDRLGFLIHPGPELRGRLAELIRLRHFRWRYMRLWHGHRYSPVDETLRFTSSWIFLSACAASVRQ